MLMNDEAMNQFIEKDNKQPNKLANILFEDEESWSRILNQCTVN